MLTYAVPAVRFSTSALIGLPAIGPTNFVASKSPWAKTPLKRPPPGAAGGGPPIGYSQTMTGPAVFESPRWMWLMIPLPMFAAMTLKCIVSPSALSSKIATPRACVSRGVGLSLIPARTAFHCVPAPSSARATVTANAAVTRAIASRASPTILVDNSFPSGDRIAHGDDILFPKRSSFSRSITLWSAELREPTPGHSSGGPRLLEELEMDLDEVRAVRPQDRLALAPNRLLILNEERENRVAVHEDEPRALSVHVPQRDELRHAGHEHAVRLIDVRGKSGLHPAAHRRQEALVDPRAVRSLKALRRRKGEDFLFRGRDELRQRAIDLCTAFDDLEAHGRRLPRPAGELRPCLEEGLPHGIELLQLGALLLRDHLEDVVDGPGRVAPGPVQRNFNRPAGLESLQGAVCLHAVHATHP